MDLFNQNLNVREFKKYYLNGGEVWFMSNFISETKANSYFMSLQETIKWQQEKVRVYGKTYPIPRKTAWHGDKGVKYKYSGIKCDSEPWTKELLEIKESIDHLVCKQDFNSVLLNLYRNGNDKVGWHADNEKGLGKNPIIASVSLGAERRFDLKHKDHPTEKLQLSLPSGSLVIMSGELQDNWLHQIPVQKKVKEPRINLTFRKIIK